jgi:hypothetical protein
MSPILAGQKRPRIWANRRGGSAPRGMRSLSQWVQLGTWSPKKFGDLTPYLTYGLHTCLDDITVYSPPVPQYILNDVVYCCVRNLVLAYMSQSLVCHRSGNISFYSVHTPQAGSQDRQTVEGNHEHCDKFTLLVDEIYSRVVRASDCQFEVATVLGSIPTSLRINGIWEATEEVALNKVNTYKNEDRLVKKTIFYCWGLIGMYTCPHVSRSLWLLIMKLHFLILCDQKYSV